MELKKIREHLIIYDCLFFDRASIKERANIKDIILIGSMHGKCHADYRRMVHKQYFAREALES